MREFIIKMVYDSCIENEIRYPTFVWWLQGGGVAKDDDKKCQNHLASTLPKLLAEWRDTAQTSIQAMECPEGIACADEDHGEERTEEEEIQLAIALSATEEVQLEAYDQEAMMHSMEFDDERALELALAMSRDAAASHSVLHQSPLHSFRLVNQWGSLLTEVYGAVDSVEQFVQQMDEGVIAGIPPPTTDIDGTWLTGYALEWNERILQDRGNFSDLGVPESAELTAHLLVKFHDSLVTRPQRAL